jgi:hypothetical protein
MKDLRDGGKSGRGGGRGGITSSPWLH